MYRHFKPPNTIRLRWLRVPVLWRRRGSNWTAVLGLRRWRMLILILVDHPWGSRRLRRWFKLRLWCRFRSRSRSQPRISSQTPPVQAQDQGNAEKKQNNTSNHASCNHTSGDGSTFPVPSCAVIRCACAPCASSGACCLSAAAACTRPSCRRRPARDGRSNSCCRQSVTIEFANSTSAQLDRFHAKVARRTAEISVRGETE